MPHVGNLTIPLTCNYQGNLLMQSPTKNLIVQCKLEKQLQCPNIYIVPKTSNSLNLCSYNSFIVVLSWVSLSFSLSPSPFPFPFPPLPSPPSLYIQLSSLLFPFFPLSPLSSFILFPLSSSPSLPSPVIFHNSCLPKSGRD